MNLPVKVRTPCANLADIQTVTPLHKQLEILGYDCACVLGCYVDENRNRAVSGNDQRVSQRHQDGVIVFIDSDIGCDQDDVQALVDACYTYPIIGVPYRTQKDDGLDCCGNRIGSKTGIIEVPQIGFGLIAIRTNIFNRLQFPYFRRPVIKKGEFADLMGEDLYFCQQVRKAGFKIHAHYGIHINHNIRKDQIMEKGRVEHPQLQPQQREVPNALEMSQRCNHALGVLSQVNALIAQTSSDWTALVQTVERLQKENAELRESPKPKAVVPPKPRAPKK